jgi:deoxyribodipyrimidine photo-lyase
LNLPEKKISDLCKEYSIGSIYTQKEWTKEEVDSNNLIKKSLAEDIKFIEDYDQFLYHPDSVTKDFSKIPLCLQCF